MKAIKPIIVIIICLCLFRATLSVTTNLVGYETLNIKEKVSVLSNSKLFDINDEMASLQELRINYDNFTTLMSADDGETFKIWKVLPTEFWDRVPPNDDVNFYRVYGTDGEIKVIYAGVDETKGDGNAFTELLQFFSYGFLTMKYVGYFLGEFLLASFDTLATIAKIGIDVVFLP